MVLIWAQSFVFPLRNSIWRLQQFFKFYFKSMGFLKIYIVLIILLQLSHFFPLFPSALYHSSHHHSPPPLKSMGFDFISLYFRVTHGIFDRASTDYHCVLVSSQTLLRGARPSQQLSTLWSPLLSQNLGQSTPILLLVNY